MRGAGEGRRAERRVLVGSNAEVAYEGKNFGDDVHKGVVKCVLVFRTRRPPPHPTSLTHPNPPIPPAPFQVRRRPPQPEAEAR
jgi:hypothetical protein